MLFSHTDTHSPSPPKKKPHKKQRVFCCQWVYIRLNTSDFLVFDLMILYIHLSSKDLYRASQNDYYQQNVFFKIVLWALLSYRRETSKKSVYHNENNITSRNVTLPQLVKLTYHVMQCKFTKMGTFMKLDVAGFTAYCVQILWMQTTYGSEKVKYLSVHTLNLNLPPRIRYTIERTPAVCIHHHHSSHRHDDKSCYRNT